MKHSFWNPNFITFPKIENDCRQLPLISDFVEFYNITNNFNDQKSPRFRELPPI